MSLSQGYKPILAGVATLLLVAACGQAGSSTAPSASAAASAGASPSASAAASQGPAEAYEVDVATDPTLGSYLVGEDGMTLYLFGHDTSGKSTCNTSCASNWPPFTLASGDTVKAGSGITGTISTIKRDDGTTQVAINGMPLYYFAGDSAKGQINGQGVGNVWYAAGVDGKPITGAAAAGSPGASQCVAEYAYSCP